MGAWSIQHGVVSGPPLNITIGSSFFILSRTDEYPDCHPFSAGCVAASLHPAGAQPQYYTVWIITRQVRREPNGAEQETLGGGRLVKWLIRP